MSKGKPKQNVETVSRRALPLFFSLNSPHLLHVKVIILVRLGDIVAPRRPEDSSEEEEEEIEETGEANEDEEEATEAEGGEYSLAAFAAAAAASTMLLSTASSRGWSEGDARVAIRGCRLSAAVAERADAKVMGFLFRQRCKFDIVNIIVGKTLAAVIARCVPPPSAAAAAGLPAVKQVLARMTKLVFTSVFFQVFFLLQCFVKSHSLPLFSCFFFFRSLSRSLALFSRKNQK